MTLGRRWSRPPTARASTRAPAGLHTRAASAPRAHVSPTGAHCTRSATGRWRPPSVRVGAAPGQVRRPAAAAAAAAAPGRRRDVIAGVTASAARPRRHNRRSARRTRSPPAPPTRGEATRRRPARRHSVSATPRLRADRQRPQLAAPTADRSRRRGGRPVLLVPGQLPRRPPVARAQGRRRVLFLAALSGRPAALRSARAAPAAHLRRPVQIS